MGHISRFQRIAALRPKVAEGKKRQIRLTFTAKRGA
jgi:hypothetical protein